jgi:para-nitrobenzyl esterase
MTKNLVSRRTFVETVCAGTSWLAFSPVVYAAEPDVVDLPAQGKIRGSRSGSVRSFKGIPYARNPSGLFRFRAPGPAPRWSGVRDATSYGSPCIQNNRDEANWQDPTPASEDCLYLNVWTAARDSQASKPVMVWFHGGGYTSGSGGLPTYDGSHLAQTADVVVVTVNHRLNIFGYLWLGDLLPDHVSDGNAGQRDLVAALRWVRANIALFGGNPDNVTIFGESGGGGKVSALLATPAARNLFHKAIVESGSQSFVSTREEATATTLDVLYALNLRRHDAAKLLTESPDRLLEASNLLEGKKGILAFQPVVDWDLMPHQTWSPVAPEESVDIPMIIGSNSDEAAAFLPDMDKPLADDGVIRSRLKASLLSSPLSDPQFSDLLAGYRKLLPRAARLELAVAMATDLAMWNSAIHQAERKVSRRRAAVFMYEFTWKTPCFGGMWAIHGIELPFVFGNLIYGAAWDGADSDALRAAADPANRRSTLAQQAMAAWGAFAHTGNPTTASLPWPAYDTEKRATLMLGPTTQVVEDPNRDRRRLIHDLPAAW